jgi:hypothetical protein
MPDLGPTFRALSREAALAADHIGLGVTALGRANYAHTSYYSQAFFALSVGFERSAKLALVVDHAIKHGGQFPSGHMLRRYGHNLRELLNAADEVAQTLPKGPSPSDSLPRTPIHEAIVDVLNDFASNVTRYYNLDVVTWGSNVRTADDPIRSWFERVVTPVLAKHWSASSRARVERNADAVGKVSGYALVWHQSESGAQLDNMRDASFETGRGEAAAPYVRMYVLQIARFFAHLMMDLTHASGGVRDIPHLSEFYTLYFNNDAYFRRRSSWSRY